MDALSLAALVAHVLAQDPSLVTGSGFRDGPVATSRFPAAQVVVPLPAMTSQDTMFEYSAAYYRRLDIHRAASYAILPLFALQFAAGTQLYEKSIDAPAWARYGHRIGATGVAALFVVNTLTGVPNLIEGRKDPNRRGRKVFHALMMLTAEAGFTATGILAERAETSPRDRSAHRALALSSMGIALIGYFSMIEPDSD